ncbi:MAG TPA: cytochrome c [Trueperaceae bacterium]
MRHFVFSLILLAAVVLAVASAAGKNDRDAPPALRLLHVGGQQVVRGAQLYDKNCAVCHGDTAAGFAEARTAFPEDHQRCERCHHPGNPAIERNMIISPRNAFSLGQPPALDAAEALGSFGTAEALYSYLKANMPRYEPGRLSNSEYLDVTAFLLDINGLLPPDTVVDEGNLAGLELNRR